MHLIHEKNLIYEGADGRKSLYDLTIPKNWNGKIILFVHGYMGFKDWGCWNLVGEFFVENSFGFVKYNVSHNGGTTEHPIDFPDTDAFARNTYSKELEDFESIIKTLDNRLKDDGIAGYEIYPIGHSRGGGIVALQSKHPRIDKWASWAGISSIAKRFPQGETLEAWRENRYRYVKNGRTKQELPHHFDQFVDFEANRARLNIENYCKSNSKPCLILHGREDTSVSLSEGENLANWTQTPLLVIENTQHTFGASHPWSSSEMPKALEEVCRQTLLFFES
jgi:pimeloyl-ACP methyl ester carboxylesterase